MCMYKIIKYTTNHAHKSGNSTTFKSLPYSLWWTNFGLGENYGASNEIQGN